VPLFLIREAVGLNPASAAINPFPHGAQATVPPFLFAAGQVWSRGNVEARHASPVVLVARSYAERPYQPDVRVDGCVRTRLPRQSLALLLSTAMFTARPREGHVPLLQILRALAPPHGHGHAAACHYTRRNDTLYCCGVGGQVLIEW